MFRMLLEYASFTNFYGKLAVQFIVIIQYILTDKLELKCLLCLRLQHQSTIMFRVTDFKQIKFGKIVYDH